MRGGEGRTARTRPSRFRCSDQLRVEAEQRRGNQCDRLGPLHAARDDIRRTLGCTAAWRGDADSDRFLRRLPCRRIGRGKYRILDQAGLGERCYKRFVGDLRRCHRSARAEHLGTSRSTRARGRPASVRNSPRQSRPFCGVGNAIFEVENAQRSRTGLPPSELFRTVIHVVDFPALGILDRCEIIPEFF